MTVVGTGRTWGKRGTRGKGRKIKGKGGNMIAEQSGIIELVRLWADGQNLPVDRPDGLLMNDLEELRLYSYEMEKAKFHIEKRLLELMDERGATSIPSNIFRCEYEQKTIYDREKFAPLKEIFVETDLYDAWRPAYTEQVEVAEKWDATQVKKHAKRYGSQALAILESATRLGPKKLVFNRWGDTNG